MRGASETDEEKDEKRRGALFAGASAPAPAPSSSRKVARDTKGVAADLEGLKTGFAERGEKLSRLTDKAEELNNAAEEFEKMCTRLNRQQQNRWW